MTYIAEAHKEMQLTSVKYRNVTEVTALRRKDKKTLNIPGGLHIDIRQKFVLNEKSCRGCKATKHGMCSVNVSNRCRFADFQTVK